MAMNVVQSVYHCNTQGLEDGAGPLDLFFLMPMYYTTTTTVITLFPPPLISCLDTVASNHLFFCIRLVFRVLEHVLVLELRSKNLN